MEAGKIDFKKIEAKWQKEWEKKKVFEVKAGKKKKYYVLEMYPYPSGSGLHMGHAFNYTIGDIFARFKRMNNFNVLYPMGYDSFGLPAENAAIKAKTHPKKYTEKAIKNFINQQKELGLSYDWNRLIMTHIPKYYKWNQFFFLKFYEKGLVYRKKAPVNYCKKCDTVLANEQVHNGFCWRHPETEVQTKQLEQWFIKTTKYSDELLSDIKKLEWPERIKIMQKNWIGKSYGVEINFKINGEKWPVFTTRPDTIYGVTFMVVSCQHLKLMELVTDKQKKQVEKFLREIKSTKQEDLDKLEKEGVFTGSYAINPLTNEKVPVYAGNFVLADYGSGMIMAVPAHDQRDFEFAKKYQIKIKEVIKGGDIKETAYVDEGILVSSEKFNGINSKEAIEKITDYIVKNKLGKKSIQYKFKDWLVSRQRYWGTPIPIVYCDKCGIVPVSEKNLPIKLPEKVKFGKGNPLATNKEFVNVKCPKCGKKARRETDTMDTFFDSSWYYLRYCDPENNKQAFDKKKVEYWMPVDQYIGGAEHACMHLIYARFFSKALRDLKMLKFDEPFIRLFNQGMLHGLDGFVMAKSRGNVVLPEEISKKYGIDAARLFLVSIASPDKDIEWSEKGIQGSFRFVNKVINYFDNYKSEKSDEKIKSKMNKTVKEITNDIEKFNYNLAIIKLRDFFNSMNKNESKEVVENFLKLFSVFCPHIAEELWHEIGNKSFISLEKWPEAGKIDEKFGKIEKANEQLIKDIKNILNIVKGDKIYIYVIPSELQYYDSREIEKRTCKEVRVYAVNDKDKFDPQGKAKKAKPGKPAIYVG